MGFEGLKQACASTLANRCPKAVVGVMLERSRLLPFTHYRCPGEACMPQSLGGAGFISQQTFWKNPASLRASLHVMAAGLCQSPALSHFLPAAPSTHPAHDVAISPKVPREE